MKTFESYNEYESEEKFIELSHLNELEIKFDFINKYNIFRLDEKLFYFYKDECIFSQYKGHNYLSIEVSIWEYFMNNMKINEDYDIILIARNVLSKYLNITGYDIDFRNKFVNNQINANFDISKYKDL